VVDYSNAYRQDGSPNPAHRLWCCVLSLVSVLLAALPGHATGALLLLLLVGRASGLLRARQPMFTLLLLCFLSTQVSLWLIELMSVCPACSPPPTATDLLRQLQWKRLRSSLQWRRSLACCWPQSLLQPARSSR
jgi:hypothetical protein